MEQKAMPLIAPPANHPFLAWSQPSAHDTFQFQAEASAPFRLGLPFPPAEPSQALSALGHAVRDRLTSLQAAVTSLQTQVLPLALARLPAVAELAPPSSSARLAEEPGQEPVMFLASALHFPAVAAVSSGFTNRPLSEQLALSGAAGRRSKRIRPKAPAPGSIAQGLHPGAPRDPISRPKRANGNAGASGGLRSSLATASASTAVANTSTAPLSPPGSNSPTIQRSSSSSGSSRSQVLARTASVGGSPATIQQHLVAGGLAGMASRTATAPLETVRLRMMSAGVQGTSVASTARELWSEAGWRAFFKGNLLNVLRAAPQKAIDFCAFETFKRVLHKSFPDSPAELRLAASGAMAGGLSTLLLYPLDSVRGRMLGQRAGSAFKYAGVGDAFLSIAKKEGIGSLYRGLAPSLLSILPEAAIAYGFADVLKMAYQRATGKEHVGPVPALFCGVTAAFTGQLVAYPLEVVARHAQVSTVRRGVLKTAHDIVKAQGLGGLYKGIVPASAKLIPMAMISFGVYESAKILLAQLDAQQQQEELKSRFGVAKA